MQIELDLELKQLSKKPPIIYPGGKQRSIKYIKPLLPNITSLVSPFVGGGAFELDCAASGIKVIGFDRFEPLVNFWNQWVAKSDKIVDAVLDLFPLSFEQKKIFYKNELKPACKDIDGKILTNFERATYFFLVNRQSFRGLTLARGPQRSWSNCTANVNLFKKLKGWHNPNIVIGQKDYRETIEEYNGKFMYLDPPYVDQGDIYGCKEDKHQFDHYEFKERIADLKSKWILSYKKHNIIMDLYKDFNIIEYSLSHKLKPIKGERFKTELLITNY